MARQRVLVIEDDPALMTLLVELLESEGYAVTATDSALGAIGLVQQLRPCIILLDLGLPYRSGGSLLTDLKAEPSTAHIPVLVVSGMPEALSDARRAMTTAIVEKPLEANALLEAVRTACASAPAEAVADAGHGADAAGMVRGQGELLPDVADVGL